MYRWVEHTAELELEIEAQTEEAVYREALAAMAELLGDDGESEPPARGRPASDAFSARELAVEEPDRARLLAAFLGELAFLAETERFVPLELARLTTNGRRLEATVHGRSGEPPHLVKAVTYHRLSFEGVHGGWRARAVLDV